MLATVVMILLVVLRTTGWHPATVPISGQFDSTGDMRLVFAKPLIDTTSPACGCIDDSPPGGWEGITMPATDLQFGLAQTHGATQYNIFSPDPASWDSLPADIGLDYQAQVVIAPTATELTPSMFNRSLPRNFSVWSEHDMVADWLSLKTTSPLNVAAFGREPLAAIGPAAGVPVTVTYASQQAAPSDPSLTLRVPFGASSPHPEVGASSIPLVDVLGSQIFLWTRLSTPTEYIADSWNAIPPPLYQANAPPVNTQVSAQIFQPEIPTLPKLQQGLSAWLIVRIVPNSAFTVRVEADPGNAASNTDYAPPNKSAAPGSQALVVHDDNVNANTAALAKSFAWTDQHPFVWLNNLYRIKNSSEVNSRTINGQPVTSDLYESPWALEFAYPPPPVDGVNVFGPISDLQMSSAQGQMIVGDSSQQSMTVGTPVELRDIRGQGVIGRHMTIPVQLNGGNASIHIQGSAVVTENGVSKRVAQAWWRSLLPSEDPWGTMLAIASVILGIAALRVQTQPRRP
jgi:hypothetical protein